MPCMAHDLSVKVRSWELAVQPRNMEEVLGVTRNIKFLDKGSISESNKPAGRSESEPICSLVNSVSGVADPVIRGEGWNICLRDNCRRRQVSFRGSRGDAGKSCEEAREALADAVQGSN